jgi:iron complex outermembrane recepter protein
MCRSRTRAIRGVLLASAVSLTAPSIAAAQTAPQTTPADTTPIPEPITDADQTADAPTSAQSEDIIVTGSRIRGATPVGSTVIAVGRNDFGATAAVSTSEIFRDIPQVVNVGVNETNRGAQGGSGNITYANAINLRGIGPGATLTLIDGHRVVGGGTRGEFIDPSVVPLLALQRVEVVADGASAVYGSDAVAGVANLILRRDIDGVEANARFGAADNYSTRQLGAAIGKVWNTGQVLLAFEHSYHSALNGLDRPYIRSDQRAFGGPDFRSTNCNPGNIVVGGVSYAIPEGGVTSGTAGVLRPNTRNRCEVGALSDVIPEIEKNGAVLTFRQELAPGVTVSGDGFYYKRTYGRAVAVQAQALVVPRSNAFFVAPPGTNPASVQVQYFFGRDYGDTYNYNGSSEAYQGTIGLDVDLFGDWNVDLRGSYGYNEDVGYNYNPNPTALTAALASSNPATAFNPFGGVNSPAVLAAIGNYVTLAAPGSGDLIQIQAQASGSLFRLPGGALRLAFGGEYNRINATAGTYRGPIGALTGADVELGRNFKSAFAELLIPIFGSDNAIGGFQRLEINLAGRYDSYSDVGDTWNPKIGVNWDPFAGLRLRGNWGTSFRAPTLFSGTTNNPTLRSENFIDPQSPTGITPGYFRNEGNPNLTPEEATTWSLGLDLTPELLRGFTASATYFNVDYRRQISTVLGDISILQRAELYPGLITRNPSAQLIAELAARLPIQGTPLPTVGVLVDARPNNLGVSLIDGVDFIANYRFETNDGSRFGVGVNGIWYNSFKVAQTDQSPAIERINFINFPVRYRLRGTASWQKNGFRVASFVNHVPSYRNNSATPEQRIADWTTVDLDLSYEVPSGGGRSWLRGMNLSLNVTNLFDRDPPYAILAPDARQSGGFDVQQSSPLGRLITAGIGLRF